MTPMPDLAAAPAAAFAPPVGLRNPHLQSSLASLRPRRRDRAGMAHATHQRLLDCGAGVRLLAAHSPHPRARSLAVLIHGWEGSQDSVYLHALGCRLYAAGHSVLRLNLRDHGGSHALNEQPFHSGRIAEVIGACRAAQELEPGLPLVCVGFSLGGNFALRIGLFGPAAGVTPTLTIGVSPCINPRATLEAIDAHPLYRRYFHRKWRADLHRKMDAWPGRYDAFAELAQLDHFIPATRRFARDFTEYGDLDAYLDAYTLHPARLLDAPSPLALITARDDPVIPFADFSGLHRGGAVRAFVAPSRGGHCGFIRNWTMDSWVEDVTLELVDTVVGK